MKQISVDFSRVTGTIKPMHSVNNGPAGSRVRGTSSFDDYAAAGIPFARNHDASFYSGYGGEHTVDVHRIFKRFEADENDPASYSFESTDRYTKDILDAGTKVFYRLGASIEHQQKFGTIPPADFEKWARICEHIIRHYNEGWADGFHYDIEYWEIWNEPDTGYKQNNSPTWGGTMDEFFVFFEFQDHLAVVGFADEGLLSALQIGTHPVHRLFCFDLTADGAVNIVFFQSVSVQCGKQRSVRSFHA